MLTGYIGQEDRLAALKAAIISAKANTSPLPHMLLLGRSGNGKTHLARCIAQEMQVPFVVMHAPSMIERKEITDKIIEADGGILFIDEIHALNRSICEDMYSVIDNGVVLAEVPVYGNQLTSKWVDSTADLPANCVEPWIGPGLYAFTESVVIGYQTQQKSVTVSIVGATTDESLLPTPFYNRLSQLKVHLRQYTNEELTTIGLIYADEMRVPISNRAAMFLAKRALASPRRIKQLVDRAADTGDITLPNARHTAARLGVDPLGLEHPHRDILRALAEAENGLSRTSLSQKLGIPPRNLEHYWPDLLRLNLVTIDTRHRVTEDGKKYVQRSQ